MSAQVQITETKNSGKQRTYKYTFPIGKTSDVSDGYHTFAELYRYRMLLQAAWFNSMKLASGSPESGQPYWYDVHKSWRHSDGELCFGKDNYFVVVAELPTGQITNHYKGEFWDLFDIPEKERANEYDGHTPEEAADRIERFVRGQK